MELSTPPPEMAESQPASTLLCFMISLMFIVGATGSMGTTTAEYMSGSVKLLEQEHNLNSRIN